MTSQAEKMGRFSHDRTDVPQPSTKRKRQDEASGLSGPSVTPRTSSTSQQLVRVAPSAAGKKIPPVFRVDLSRNNTPEVEQELKNKLERLERLERITILREKIQAVKKRLAGRSSKELGTALENADGHGDLNSSLRNNSGSQEFSKS